MTVESMFNNYPEEEIENVKKSGCTHNFPDRYVVFHDVGNPTVYCKKCGGYLRDIARGFYKSIVNGYKGGYAMTIEHCIKEAVALAMQKQQYHIAYQLIRILEQL
jgi:hypothetical protein